MLVFYIASIVTASINFYVVFTKVDPNDTNDDQLIVVLDDDRGRINYHISIKEGAMSKWRRGGSNKRRTYTCKTLQSIIR